MARVDGGRVSNRTLTGVENGPRRIAPAEGRFVLGERNQLKLSASDTNGAFSLLYTSTPPGKGPPLHVHEHEDEIFCVLAGRYRFTCGDRVFEADPGHIARLPRFLPHTFRNVLSTTGRILEFVVPGGIERYFDRVNYLGANAAANLTERAQVAREFGIYFVSDPSRPLPAEAAEMLCSLPPGIGPAMQRDGRRVTAKLGANETRGRCAVLEVELAAGGVLPRPGWEEGPLALWGLEGELTVRVGATTLDLAPAVTVALPAGIPFELANAGPFAARVLVLATPAGMEKRLGIA